MEVEYDDSGWQGRTKQQSTTEVNIKFDVYVNAKPTNQNKKLVYSYTLVSK